jgi:hypothetical protein
MMLLPLLDSRSRLALEHHFLQRVLLNTAGLCEPSGMYREGLMYPVASGVLCRVVLCVSQRLNSQQQLDS